MVHHDIIHHNLRICVYIDQHTDYCAISIFYKTVFIHHEELEYDSRMMDENFWRDFISINYAKFVNLETINKGV